MDEKTEQLRDLFMDVADDATVTEGQVEERGTLGGTETDVDERLEAVIDRMRAAYGFETDLADDVLCRVVRGYYDGRSDEALAAELSVPAETVRTARLDLHLIREDDAAPVDLDTLRRALDADADVERLAAEFDLDPAAVESARAVLRARDEARRASRRYRSEFEEVLTDADLAVRLTASVRDDGLAEATEDIETDVDF